MADELRPIRDFVPIDDLLADALFRRAATHSLYVVYRQLLRNIDRGLEAYSRAELADALDVNVRSVYRALALLRKLGVVREVGSHTVVMTHTADPTLIRVLREIAAGKITIDVPGGVITHPKAGEWDYSKRESNDRPGAELSIFAPRRLTSMSVGLTSMSADMTSMSVETAKSGQNMTSMSVGLTSMSHMTSMSCDEQSFETDACHCSDSTYGVSSPVDDRAEAVSAPENGEDIVVISKSRSTVKESRSTSTRIKGEIEQAFQTTPEILPMYDPDCKNPKDPAYYPRLKDQLIHPEKFDPTRDPFRADIEAVCQYANQQWGTKMTPYGRPGKLNARYRHIWRAFGVWGATVEHFRTLIDNVPTHHYWGPAKVRELSKFLTKESNFWELVDYRPPVGQKFDRRAVELAAQDKPASEIVGVEF